MFSMTGYGKSARLAEEYQIEVELKSVNHRYLDIQCRLPKNCSSFEMEIRNGLKRSIGRGRVECSVTIKKEAGKEKQVHVHWDLLDQVLLELSEGLSSRNQLVNTETILSALLQDREFIEIEAVSTDKDILKPIVLVVLKEAIEKLKESKATEGEEIGYFLADYLFEVENYTQQLKQDIANIERDYFNKLTDKVAELTGGAVDESRVLTEVAILLDKGDISEELDRLMIHIKKMKELINKSDEPVGRELDFLVQEINREINTIGAKSTKITIKDATVKMKTAVEKVREQIQNVE